MALLVALAVAIGFAVTSPSRPITKVAMHDSGIWVTNNTDDLLGRVNLTGGGIDGFLSPGQNQSGNLDVFQDGASVVSRDIANGQLTPIDPKRVVNDISGVVAVPPTALVAMSSGSLAVLDTNTGQLRVARYRPGDTPDLSALDSAAPPAASLGAGTQSTMSLAIADDGTVFAISANGTQAQLTPNGIGGFADALVTSTGVPIGGVTATNIGKQLVYLDTTTGTLYLPNSITATIPASVGAVMQQPSPDSSVVFVATTTSLYAVSFDGNVTAMASGLSGLPARPVVVAGVVYAAWAGQPGRLVAGPADGRASADPLGLDRDKTLTQPVFRVNHNRVLLNDMATGRVFDVASLRSLDDWQTLTPPPSKDVGDSQQNTTHLNDLPPAAEDDNLGARPGRTTVLHVLDNDTNSDSDILAVTSVTQPITGATTAISSDAQTILFTADAGLTGIIAFTYSVSNGHGEATARVQVTMKTDSQNGPPDARTGYTPLTYPVAARSTIGIFVTQNWRDPDGDPVSVVSANANGNSIPVSPEGKIYYTAPSLDHDSEVTIDYVVTDGHADSMATGEVAVAVLGSRNTVASSPIAQADLVRGVAGVPLTFSPLDNDIPGADPRDPTAKLALAGSVASQAGVTVTTDVVAGTVTATAQEPGTYTLTYTAAFGSAAFDQGIIRLEISAAGSSTPVAVPDNVTVRGTVTATVDVLGNDMDPANSMLTVTNVVADDPDQLTVTVFGGRWVRLQPVVENLTPNPQIVHYAITNGQSDPVEGTVMVTQVSAPQTDALILGDDRAVVRTGDTTLVDVLANDASQSGKPLVLSEQPDPSLPAGQLPILVVGSSATDTTDAGTAFVVDNKVRYIAPVDLLSPIQVAITYTAMTSDGSTAQSATLYVDVRLEPTDQSPDSAPQPSLVEARTTSGDSVVIHIPIYGVDPDGDSVTVIGIASAPALGRVTAITPTSITYQAYPNQTNTGTDSFDYVVADRYGQTGIGKVRIGLAAVELFPPSVAVDDMVTAQPAVSVTVQPLVNDLVAAGDDPRILPVGDLPAGVSLSDDGRTFLATAPATQDDPPVQLSYLLSGAGGDGPTATVTIKAQDGYLNPPRVYDTVAVVDATGLTATADPLATAWDVDGPKSDVHLVSVEAGTIGLDGKVIDIPAIDVTQALVYVAADGDGNQSSAIIFVPPTGAGAPQLRPGVEPIQMLQDETKTVSLADYVFSPRDRDVHITVAERVTTGPADDLMADEVSPTSLTLTGLGGYTGPASVSLEVTDAADATDATGLTAFVTIPVQIGPKAPVLRCPTIAEDVVQGGAARTLDITALCHVWMPDATTAASISYVPTWSTPLESVSATGGAQVTVKAAGTAVPDSSAQLQIAVDNSPAVPGVLAIHVVAASKPKVSAPNIPGVAQGTTVTQRVAIISPLLDSKPTIFSVRQTGGSPCQIGSYSSGTSFTLTPGTDSHGTMSFQVVASDLGDVSRTERQVTTTFTMTVYGRPDTPDPPQPGEKLMTHAVALAWASPADNGATIQEYQVQATDGRFSRSCGQFNRCDITGVPNGLPIAFEVRARNKAGWSDWSQPGPPFTPNETPGMAPNFTASNPQDGELTLTWDPAPVDGTGVTNYHLSWTGGSSGSRNLSGLVTSSTVSGLDNDQETTFSLVAENDAGLSAMTAKTKGQSSGKPHGLSSPAIKADDLGDKAQVTISWDAADPNGPGPVSYQVTRSGGGDTKTFASTTDRSISDNVSFNGTEYTYSVTATNATGGPMHTSDSHSTTWKAVGKPAAWPADAITATATGANGTVKVDTHYPASRGATISVKLSWNGGSTALDGLSTAGGSSSTVVTGLANGSTITFSLEVCNESTCSSDSDTAKAVPYGPLDAPKVASQKTGADGDTLVCTTFTGNAQGRDARLHIWADGNVSGTPADFISDYATGPISNEYCVNANGFKVDVSFHAIMQNDPDHSTRDDSSQTDNTVTSAHAKVTVRMTYGNAYDAEGACTHSSCKHMGVVALNLTPLTNYTIIFYDVNGVVGSSYSADTNKYGNFTYVLGPAFGYPTFLVWAVVSHGKSSYTTKEVEWQNVQAP